MLILCVCVCVCIYSLLAFKCVIFVLHNQSINHNIFLVMFTLYAKVHKPVCTNLHLDLCVAIPEYSLVLLHSYFALIFALDSDQLIEICLNFFFFHVSMVNMDRDFLVSKH